MKINWTRRNKLFAGMGGVAVVIAAVLLVFTFVGMPGGGKLFGTAQVDPGYWRDEGYNWVTDSVPFQIASELDGPIGNPLGYGKGYTNERAQFDKVYQWVKNNITYDANLEYSLVPDQDPQPEVSESITLSNATDVERQVTLSQSQTQTMTDTTMFSVKVGVNLETSVTAKINADVIEAGTSVVAGFSTEVNSQNQRTKTVSIMRASQETFTVPAWREITVTFSATPMTVSGTWRMTVVARQKPNAEPRPEIVMNYGTYPTKALEGTRTYMVSGDVRGIKHTNFVLGTKQTEMSKQ